ncbi:DUF7619 domain-containing protein [Pontibacter actiniarum]|uniref:T9SS C-terminal target domain-containing protein n=1 Tax=Pontibacter actiniarum TaxID=323450 RepID=A0A1X9YR03_9BACT|nr:T9SS type A sorting domain-containing protein [Pontibacter actiniarum]ARS35297.1 T9SS C-terminal target domain-containing protein [Pontibacter actiniarum]
MKQTFTLLLLVMLFSYQASAQKALLLQTFEQAEFSEASVFAEGNFYLNQGAYFEAFNFATRANHIVDKPPGQFIQKGKTLGAVGSSVLFSNGANDVLHIADMKASRPLQALLQSEQIVTGKDYTYLLYRDLNGEGTKIISVDSRTFTPQKAFITRGTADVHLAYFEKENLLYFVHRTADNTVALYASDGSYERTKLVTNLSEEVGSGSLLSSFFANGEDLYLINFYYQGADYKNRTSHVYKVSDGVTDLGTFPYFSTSDGSNYLKQGAFYGYDNSTQSIVKSTENGLLPLLSDVSSVTFVGDYKNKLVFTVRDEWDEQVDTALVKLYETDGTPAGTKLIADKVAPPSYDNQDQNVIAHRGKLYFFRKDETHGPELWQYDGQSATLLQDVIPGQDGMMYPLFYEHEDELYFTARLTASQKTLRLYKFSDSASTFQLQSYVDSNGNQIKDADEPLLTNVKYKLAGDALTVLPSEGSSTITLEDGSYTLVASPASGWVPVNGEQKYTVSLPADDTKVYSFGFTPTQPTTKVDASLMSEFSRCGFPTSYTLHYSNTGFTSTTGTIKLKPEATFSYESASPAPTEVSGDTLIWQIKHLPIGQKGRIIINFTMPGVEHMGDTLTSSLYTRFSSDVNSSTHTDTTTLQQILTCSYDPNDIQANPAGLGEKHLTLKNRPLEYLIRFQNMGTDKAFNIVVKNELQPEFDISTFKVIGSSHDMYTVVKGNQLSFHFDNIQLPDDKVDEPGSHGYILYSIKPKSDLADSTLLNNQAFIYFDYNPAIETNVAFNTLVTRLPAPESVLAVGDALEAEEMKVYPNPAEDAIHVAWPAAHQPQTAYQLLNAKGQQVQQLHVRSGTVHQIDVSALPPGLYFLKAVKANKTFARKIIIR